MIQLISTMPLVTHSKDRVNSSLELARINHEGSCCHRQLHVISNRARSLLFDVLQYCKYAIRARHCAWLDLTHTCRLRDKAS